MPLQKMDMSAYRKMLCNVIDSSVGFILYLSSFFAAVIEVMNMKIQQLQQSQQASQMGTTKA